MLKLQTLYTDFYVVKEGDTLESICRAARVSPVALCRKNALSAAEVTEGMLLLLPLRGNEYTVQPGDHMETLCGSSDRFEELNGRRDFYPGMRVRIPYS